MLTVEALSPAKGRKRVQEEEDPSQLPEGNEKAIPQLHIGEADQGHQGQESALLYVTLSANMPPECMRRLELHTHVHPQVYRVGLPSTESVLSITFHPIGHPPTLIPCPSRQFAPPIPQLGKPCPDLLRTHPHLQKTVNLRTMMSKMLEGTATYCHGPSYIW